MRICFVKGSLFGPISGADEIILAYVVTLLKAGIAPILLLTYPFTKGDRYFYRFRALGVPVRVLSRGVLYLGLRVLRRLIMSVSFGCCHCPPDWILYWAAYFFFWRHRPDIVHVVEPLSGTPAVMRAAFARGIPVVYQEFSTPAERTEHRAAYRELSLVSPQCALIAALSPVLARLCSERIAGGRRVSVIPATISVWSEGAPPSRRTEPVIGFAGRFEPLKGPALLVEAISLLASTGIGCKLRLAGEGPQLHDLQNMCERLGVHDRIDFAGLLVTPEERRLFFSDIDILCHPSLLEGTPVSILEAMASRVPIVATDVGGIPDLLRDGSGVLVPAGDARAIADALTVLIQDPTLRGRLGSLARKRFDESYRPELVGQTLLRHYSIIHHS